MKKYSWITIGCLCLFLLGYSVIANANESSSSSSQGLTGSFIAITEGNKEIKLQTSAGTEAYPLAKSVWVYRNSTKAGLQDLQPGDKLEIVLNKSKQAAYVKAFSPEGATKEAVPSPTAAPTASPSPTAAPSPTVASSPTSAPSPTAVPSLTATPSSGPSQHEEDSPSDGDWDKLYVKVQGAGVNLHLEQNFSGNSHKSKANIHTKGQGNVNLDGDSAASFIQEIMKNVDLHSATAKAQLLAEISKQLGLAESDLRIDIDVKWLDSHKEDEDENEGNEGNEEKKAEQHQSVKQQADKHGKPDKKEKHNKHDD